MKPLIFALCVVFAFGGLSAQKPGWQPSPGHYAMPIWPGAVPDISTKLCSLWLQSTNLSLGVTNFGT